MRSTIYDIIKSNLLNQRANYVKPSHLISDEASSEMAAIWKWTADDVSECDKEAAILINRFNSRTQHLCNLNYMWRFPVPSQRLDLRLWSLWSKLLHRIRASSNLHWNSHPAIPNSWPSESVSACSPSKNQLPDVLFSWHAHLYTPLSSLRTLLPS